MAKLFLVSTPIGNLEDLSPRAAEVLATVPYILAEDTRRTRILTDRTGSAARLVSLHAHNERQRTEAVLEWLDQGVDLALVSDAGTPLVSDPGARLVAAVTGAGHTVVPVPGPSAVTAALIGSGLPTERFAFLGFPERKGRERGRLLDRVARSEETVVLFESPHRLVRLLEDLGRVCGPDRRVAVARELTKIHEEFVRGTLEEAAAYYRDRSPKGEVTVVVAGASGDERSGASDEEASALAVRLIEDGMRPSEAARELARRLDLARNEAYRIVRESAEGSAVSDELPGGDSSEE